MAAVKMMAFANMSKMTHSCSVTCSLSDRLYGFGLLMLSSSQLQQLDVMQNKGMEQTILGCTRDIATDIRRYLLDLLSIAKWHKYIDVILIYCKI